MTFITTLLPLLSLLPLTLSHPSRPPPSWTPLTNISIAARQEHSTFFLPPSTIGIVGGVLPAASLADTTDLMQFYSLTTNKWESKAPVPRALNHINAAVSNGKVYILGGLAVATEPPFAWRAVADSWVYDVRSNSWRAIEGIPTGEARGSAAVGVYCGKIFLAGGMTDLVLEGAREQTTVDSVVAYDTVKGTWMKLPKAARKMPEGRDHAGGAVIGNKMYVVGGRQFGQENVKDTVFVLDLENLERGWTTAKARMPTPRGGLATGVVGNKIYTFGGEGNQELASGVFNETEAYDVVKGKWEKLTPMTVPRHGTYAASVGDKVYIPGGGIAQGAGAVSYFDVFVT